MAQREGDLINQRNGSKSRMIAPVAPVHGNQAEQDEAGDLYGIFDAVALVYQITFTLRHFATLS